MRKMIVKKHVAPDRRLILAVCDKVLMGKILKDGSIRLDLGSEFYCGEEMSKEEICSLMKKAYILNLVGKRSVGCAAELGLVDKVMTVGSVPYAQVIAVSG